jgi:CelD/BcsL family acetyltransferase involved in cellulose biosynthesis
VVAHNLILALSGNRLPGRCPEWYGFVIEQNYFTRFFRRSFATKIPAMDICSTFVSDFSVRKLDGPEAFADLTAEWESLDEEIFPRTPFTSPSWICLWWQHFRRRTLLFRDEFFCHIVRDADGRLVALVPLMRTFCLGLGLPAMRIVQFFGTDPSLTEFRGVICRPEDQDKVVRTLAEYFLRCHRDWDVFRWNGLRRPPSVYNSMAIGCEFLARHELPDYLVDLPDKWDKLRLHVSSNMRKNLRKAYESLERDGLDFTLRVVRQPEDVPAAIERFLSLHLARSEAADMVRHPNKFREPNARAFLVAYLLRLAGRGQLCIFELEVNREVVASRLTFVLGSDLYMYFAGYDTAWKKYSVMTILVAEMIKWAIEHSLQRVNLSTGKDLSKLRWKPVEIGLHDAVQISPSLRGKIAYRGFLAYEVLSRVRVRLDR